MDDPVRRHARERPHRLALRAGGRELSYAELDDAADRVARALVARGVELGDRVATSLAPGIDFAILLHAAPRAGAVLVPLPLRAPAAEHERLLGLADPRLVVAEPIADDDGRGARRSRALRHTLDPDAPHTLLFTSGTTAAPKPVELTFGNHAASARASAANLGVLPDDRWLCPLPVHHVGGLAILLRSALSGTAAIVHPRFDAAKVRASLESGEATLVPLVATQLRRLVEEGLERAPALRAALVGGGPVARELLAWARARAVPVVPTYGLTETASQIVALPVAEALARVSRGSAGRPLPGVELRIEPGTGEILVRGPSVARRALAADRWLHTGDRGRLDAEGYLWVEGRLDATIVTGGENVAAAEVEEALEAHPAVAEAAVVGVPDPEWGRAVVAYVVLDGAQRPSDAALIAHCRGRLAAHKAPKAIHRVEEFPRTESGKIARSRLVGLEAEA